MRGAHCVVLTGCINIWNILKESNQKRNPWQTLAVTWNSHSGIRNHVAIRAIWSPRFLPAKVRLIGGGAELHTGSGIVNISRLTVYFGNRYFQVGHGAWEVMIRNTEKLMGISASPNCARLYETGREFREKWKWGDRSSGRPSGLRLRFRNKEGPNATTREGVGNKTI